MKPSPILPGAIVGVLGSGQLGRMFAIAARRMGYRVHTYSPDSDTPAGQVSDVEITAPYEDLDAIRQFARGVSVVTFEFENVPSAAADAAAEFAPVRPGKHVLHAAQNRIREKSFLAKAGFPVAPFAVIESAADLERAIQEIGGPAVIKTAASGYDGKGQVRIATREEAPKAWESIGRVPAVYEKFVHFDLEVSVIAARGLDGQTVDYEPVENRHSNHILDLSICPAAVPPETARELRQIARGVMESLDVVGVLCVEFFVSASGGIFINELAPRPHNSGHLTFDACVTSQFEQQLRTVCGLAAGSTELLRPAAMANLLGDLWFHNSSSVREPDWAAALKDPDVKLHLYGKVEPRKGRKMGHLAVMAPTSAEAAERVMRARDVLISNNC